VKNRTLLNAEALNLIREAGYHDFTSFQRKVIPLILKGNDTVVEFSYQRGKTVAFILPLLLQLKRDDSGIKAIVLASKTEELSKIFREFKRFQVQGAGIRNQNLVKLKSHSAKRGLTTALLSEENEIRIEVRNLTREPDIVVCSPRRLIDHIRRANVSFSDELRVIIYIQELEPGFLEDIQFIYSKLPLKRQTVIFSPPSESVYSQSWPILRRPRVFREAEFAQGLQRAKHFYLKVSEQRKNELLLDLIFSENLFSLLVFCDNEAKAASLTRYLVENQLKAACIESSNRGKTDNLEADIIVSTEEALGSRVFTEVRGIFNYDPPLNAEGYRHRCSFLTEEPSQIFTFMAEDQYFNPNQIQEMLKVTVKNHDEPTEEEVLKGSIERIIKIIKEQEDPDELNHFRRIVKKHVPIFLRSYFMAYLFKQSLGKLESKPNTFTTLFISIGKNRRVYPRDLINLFMKSLKLKRSDIGEIKIFDNYSFMEVSLDHASDAISTLSGTSFRGRRITVNRARKKE
jgi:ATP-dependent RNA helicase DeaD